MRPFGRWGLFSISRYTDRDANRTSRCRGPVLGGSDGCMQQFRRHGFGRWLACFGCGPPKRRADVPVVRTGFGYFLRNADAKPGMFGAPKECVRRDCRAIAERLARELASRARASAVSQRARGIAVAHHLYHVHRTAGHRRLRTDGACDESADADAAVLHAHAKGANAAATAHRRRRRRGYADTVTRSDRFPAERFAIERVQERAQFGSALRTDAPRRFRNQVRRNIREHLAQ